MIVDGRRWAAMGGDGWGWSGKYDGGRAGSGGCGDDGWLSGRVRSGAAETLLEGQANFHISTYNEKKIHHIQPHVNNDKNCHGLDIPPDPGGPHPAIPDKEKRHY